MPNQSLQLAGHIPSAICYLNVSAEGHIDGSFGRVPEATPATAVFRARWLEMGADAIIYGAVTMSMFAGGWLEEVPKTDLRFNWEDQNPLILLDFTVVTVLIMYGFFLLISIVFYGRN